MLLVLVFFSKPAMELGAEGMSSGLAPDHAALYGLGNCGFV